MWDGKQTLARSFCPQNVAQRSVEQDVPIPRVDAVLGGMGPGVSAALCPLAGWPEPEELWGRGDPPEHPGSIQH